MFETGPPFKLITPNLLKIKSMTKIIKKLKVCAKWQGSKSVPSINLQGLYLEKFNFNINDKVKIEFHKNEIRIIKYSPEQILEELKKENPALKKLIERFELSPT